MLSSLFSSFQENTCTPRVPIFISCTYNLLFSVYIPVLSGSIELLEEERYLSLNNKVNHTLIVNFNLLLQNFYKLLFLAITGAQVNNPSPCIEGIFVSFFNKLQQCEHLFWSLTWEMLNIEY